MDSPFRGVVFFFAAFACGIASVLVAYLVTRLSGQNQQDHRRPYGVGIGIAVNGLLAFVVALTWEHLAPIMFDHAFGANNFTYLLDSPAAFLMYCIMSSVGVFLGYGLGTAVTAVAARESKPSWVVAAAFPLAFLAVWWNNVEHPPHGLESTIEVRVHYTYDDPDYENSIDQFYAWVHKQACPYCNYETDSSRNEGDQKPTPYVTIEKYYYRNGDLDQKVGATIRTELTGPVDAAKIHEAVRSIRSMRRAGAPKP